MMKKLLTVLLLSTATFVATASHPVESLLERIAQGASQRISVREVPSDEDFFEISADNGRPLVTGNSAVNIAAGVNWYLKYYPHIHLAWNNMKAELPEVLPLPAKA